MLNHHTQQRSDSVAIAACVVDLNGQVPTEIQLTPAGLFRARDGRPQGLQGWYIDAAIAERVIERAINTADDFVIDYDHQTLYTEKNGQKAPAGGWFKGANMEWRDGIGLFATDIEWTDKAREDIAAKEYRYISPVVAYDPKSGHVLAILMAALTNYAAIDGMADLAAIAAARFSTEPTQEDHTVDRKQLISLLGLAEDATDEQLEQALTALKAKAESVTALRGELNIDDEADITTAVATLKANAVNPDPAKFAPISVVEALKADVAELKAGITANEVDDLVAIGLSEGKLHPDQEQWASDLGKKDIEALKGYLEKTPAIAALKGNQTGGEAPQEGKAALSAERTNVAALFGNSAEDLEKYGS